MISTVAEQHNERQKTLEMIKLKIEQMNKFQHIEVLKIFKKHTHKNTDDIELKPPSNCNTTKKQYKPVKLNENKNGVYVNVSFLSPHIIDEIIAYIDYIDVMNKTLERNNALNIDEKTIET